MNWYYMESGQRVGPISESTLDILAKAGSVTAETLVWQEGMKDWTSLGKARPNAPAPPVHARPTAPPVNASARPAAPPGTPKPETGPAGSSAACSLCGRTLPEESLIRYKESLVCADCKPVFMQRLKEGAGLTGALAYAGFWIRVGAKVIDGVVLWIVGMLITLAMTPVLGTPDPKNIRAVLGTQAVLVVLQMAVATAYATWFIGRHGATLGKMATGLKVVAPDGGRVGYGRACGRYFAEILSSMILGIGYLMVAWDPERRALHDRICNTRVVRK